MTVKLNLPLIAAVLGGLAGAAGTVLTPIYGAALAGDAKAVLLAVSGLLMVIPVTHASSVVAHYSKTRNAAKIAAKFAGTPVPEEYA